MKEKIYFNIRTLCIRTGMIRLFVVIFLSLLNLYRMQFSSLDADEYYQILCATLGYALLIVSSLQMFLVAGANPPAIVSLTMDLMFVSCCGALLMAM